MKKQDLIELGIDEETAKEILIMHGRDIESFKKSVDDLETEKATTAGTVETLQQQIADANQTIEDFKSIDVDAIQARADEYQAKFEQSEKDAAEKIRQLRYDQAMNDRLRTEKARNFKTVKALIDEKKIKFIESDDGNFEFEGLDEQIQTIRESDGYLFGDDEPSNDDGDDDVPEIVVGGRSQTVMADKFEVSAREAAGLYEQ